MVSQGTIYTFLLMKQTWSGLCGKELFVEDDLEPKGQNFVHN
jgi:hypothetical protein